MAISSASREKLSWLFLESILIVLSILLAFWIDAWWSDKQKREDESLVLTSVLTEFLGWQDTVEGQHIFLTAVRKSSKTLLDLTFGHDPDLSGEAIDALLADLLWDIDPALYSAPVLKSMTSNGALNIVTNPDLRRDLVQWSIRLDRIKERAERSNKFYENRLMPFMESSTSMPQVSNAIRSAPGDPESTENVGHIEQFQIETVTDHSYLLADKEFQALLMRHSGFCDDMLYLTRDQFSAELDAMVSRVEHELADLSKH